MSEFGSGFLPKNSRDGVLPYFILLTNNKLIFSDTKTTPQSSKQFISQLFECLVCYDKVKLNNVVFCNIPVSATGKRKFLNY